MNSNILFSLRNKQSRLFLNKGSALKQGLERALFLFRVSGIPLLVSAKGDIIFARPYGGIQGVRWAAGHMGPALHGIFVGQGTRALPWVRYGIGGRTGASAPTEGLPIEFRRGRCPHRPAPGLAQSSLLSLGADASVRPLPNAPPQKRERPPGRSLLAYVFFTPPGNRPGLRPPAAGFSPGPAHPGAGR